LSGNSPQFIITNKKHLNNYYKKWENHESFYIYIYHLPPTI